MAPDLDIFRSASLLIERYGEDASIHAAMRADELMKAGDMEGCSVWKRIIKAVDELEAKEKPEGVEVHYPFRKGTTYVLLPFALTPPRPDRFADLTTEIEAIARLVSEGVIDPRRGGD